MEPGITRKTFYGREDTNFKYPLKRNLSATEENIGPLTFRFIYEARFESKVRWATKNNT